VTGATRIVAGVERSSLNAAYLRSVRAAGGLPVLLPPLIGPELAESALAGLEGLLLTGGEDIDPFHYRETPHPRLERVDPERDAFELALFQAAWSHGVPVLAICRGQQLVNVALGGTLWQDLPSERPSQLHHSHPGERTDRTHLVSIVPRSRLRDALAADEVEVNSFHHQAIRELAPRLAVSARASDGLIEGVESSGADPWVLAVQWHPEEFVRESGAPDRGLFEALVREARQFRDSGISGFRG
jgi:putative glutamine amidotransferase